MRIAVVNEVSACDKNKYLISALKDRGQKILNVGMTKKEDNPPLSYIHTGLLAAILLNLKIVDFVVGGCGTGQGFLNSAMQYPGVFCGHILTPLDVWLFAKINGGNCISLALNQGFGWAGEINLKFIFDRLLENKFGEGYPLERKIPQAESRKILIKVSEKTHKSFDEIISSIDDSIIKPVLIFPRVIELLKVDMIKNEKLKKAFKERIKKL